MICSLEHIPETPVELWACPGCGTKYPDFYVHDVYSKAPPDCLRVHPQDEMICLGCDEIMTGQEYIDMLSAKEQVNICPTCQGKGTVK